jgi:hypothetical protein
VEDFRRTRQIRDPIVAIDHTGIYWVKTASVLTDNFTAA